MLDGATADTKEQWLDILERAASGYLEGARDPKQSRGRRRQLDLLEAATRVFAREGIAKAKMADIAAEAGISVSSILSTKSRALMSLFSTYNRAS